jgi:hypothetical protein
MGTKKLKGKHRHGRQKERLKKTQISNFKNRTAHLTKRPVASKRRMKKAHSQS